MKNRDDKIKRIAEKLRPIIRERIETKPIYTESLESYSESITTTWLFTTTYIEKGTTKLLLDELMSIAKEVIEEYDIVAEEFSWFERFFLCEGFDNADLIDIVFPIYVELSARSISNDFARKDAAEEAKIEKIVQKKLEELNQ